MCVFWFELLADVVTNHVVSYDDPRIPAEVRARALLVRRLEMLPVECVARGYLTGSGLTDYQRTGEVCGIALPPGLDEASMLPEPIFTPATKAAIGEHDDNVSFEAVVETIGAPLAEKVRDLTVTLYERAAAHALTRSMLVADTKLEFGLLGDTVVLGDELVTPDSSRFWPSRLPRRPGAAVVRQAVRPGLADLPGVRLGPPLRAGAAAAAGQRHRGHPRPLHRGLSAGLRSAVQQLDRLIRPAGGGVGVGGGRGFNAPTRPPGGRPRRR